MIVFRTLLLLLLSIFFFWFSVFLVYFLCPCVRSLVFNEILYIKKTIIQVTALSFNKKQDLFIFSGFICV
jgi:hypothetical protein